MDHFTSDASVTLLEPYLNLFKYPIPDQYLIFHTRSTANQQTVAMLEAWNRIRSSVYYYQGEIEEGGCSLIPFVYNTMARNYCYHRLAYGN